MSDSPSKFAVDRRQFLAASGGALLAGALPAAANSAEFAWPANEDAKGDAPSPAGTLRKIPIGVFDPVYEKLSIDEMLDKVTALGLEAMEIGTGGYPNNHHCPLDELIADRAKAKAWQKKFEGRSIRVATLSCHGNPIHPVAKRAQKDIDTFRKTVLLAEMLDVKVIVGFSGCPGGSPADVMPNWAAYRWPSEFAEMLDWQWKEKVIPYWKEAAKYAREHGIKRLAFEMHPNFVVYNPRTLMKLREAVGEEIGANCDLSHLFWQGCDPVEVIHFLGKQGAIYHAHMKDTSFYPENVNKYGVLNFAFDKNDLESASENFRAVGYGHGASLWKSIVKAYMDVGYEGILSIENEDPILPGEVGVERAAYVLKNVRAELLGG
ncbi:MAG TPA: sugar phosphate isomerase/epimerase [Candidatus Dormibacteraeota bacterium]|nr:sugar phosphate isomerase/epimerase [Candidatus Dormibacteraeota bacterium]